VSVSLSTHVLDTEGGRPAEGVPVRLYRGDGLVAEGHTDGDGRIGELAAELEPGLYRLVFRLPSPFFRVLELEVELEGGHYHVPLLVSPYQCTTYRGS
jgi:5-hydroxyisourate hydrolase